MGEGPLVTPRTSRPTNLGQPTGSAISIGERGGRIDFRHLDLRLVELEIELGSQVTGDARACSWHRDGSG